MSIAWEVINQTSYIIKVFTISTFTYENKRSFSPEPSRFNYMIQTINRLNLLNFITTSKINLLKTVFIISKQY